VSERAPFRRKNFTRDGGEARIKQRLAEASEGIGAGVIATITQIRGGGGVHIVKNTDTRKKKKAEEEKPGIT